MGRTNWDDEKTKRFLTILVGEKEKGNTKYCWPNIIKVYNAQVGVDIDVKQAANHYSDMKKKFKAWEDLQRLTGIAFNPMTGGVDVEEQSLERYENFKLRHKSYGAFVVKKQLQNIDLLTHLFAGQTAHGIGGCFSPAMARTSNYLSKPVEDLTISSAERSVDSETEKDRDDMRLSLSAAESHSPPKSVVRKSTRSTSYKRKHVESADSIELKRRQTSFDSIVDLLKSTTVAPAKEVSRPQMISDVLETMGVCEQKGDRYFVSAIKFLKDEEHADTFLALRSDGQRWIYLEDYLDPTI